MSQLATNRDGMTAADPVRDLAELIRSFERANPRRIVFVGAKSGDLWYPWSPEAPDYLADVLTPGSGNRAWLDGRDVMLEIV